MEGNSKNLNNKEIIDILNSRVVIIKEYVRYYEVDKMEVVHHSNYFRYYELVRCFYFSKNILPYKVLENNYKIYSPLIESSSKYIKKLEFEDIFYISCFIDNIDLNKVYFRYFIIKDLNISLEELNNFFSFIENNKNAISKNNWYYNYLKTNYKTLILQNIISEGITIHTFVNKDFKPISLKNIYINEKENNIYQLLLNLKI